jgi:tetratricopeptide (TPR) repeat protein
MGQYPGIPKGVQQTFEAAFLELDADEQAVFCAVGLCARATRREIVAAVVQLTEEATDVVLNRLADISFVQYAADRQAPWSEHDVLRFFAVSRERKALLEAAHQRWFEEYTTRLAAPTHHEAFAIAVPEGLALVERLLQQKKAVEASRLFFRVFMHLTRQGSFAQALDTGAYVAAHLPDRSEERAAWLCNLGACYRNIGDPHKAIVLLEGSLEIAKLLGARGQGLVAATTGNLGACYMSLEDLPRAIALFRETERLEQDRGNREGQAKALGSLAVCAGKQGNVGEAKALLERALAMTKEEVNKSMLLGNLACCLRLQRHPREALDLHERAWRIDRDIGNVPGQANNLGNMGLCHLDLGETAKAAEELDRAIALFDSTDLAEVHEGIKNFRHALATLRGTAPRAL